MSISDRAQLAGETTCQPGVRFRYLIGLILLVVDPMFACLPYRERFEFGLREIEPALDGTWYVAWTRDGQRQTMAFHLRVDGPPRRVSARGIVASAAACGMRTLVRSASACATATFIPLEVMPLESKQGTFEALFYVGGYSFHGGVLNLWLGDHDAEVSAAVSAKGEVEHLFERPALGTAASTATVRLDSLWHVDDVF